LKSNNTSMSRDMQDWFLRIPWSSADYCTDVALK
jgi:hypothetical protein